MIKKFMVYLWDLTTRQNLGILEGEDKREVINKVKKEYHLNDNAFIELKEIN